MEESDLWRDADSLAKYADTIVDKPAIHKTDELELVIAGLFTKILDGSQAILLLLREGYSVEAEIVVRSILEVLFYMGACIRDKRAFKNYLGRELFQRLADIELVLKRYRHFGIDTETLNDLKKSRDFLRKEITAQKVEKFYVSRAADITGLFSLYLGYRTHCDAVHANPNYLKETYMDFDEISINQINIGPKNIRLKDVLLTLNSTLTYACKWYCNLLNIKMDKDFITITQKYVFDKNIK